MAQQGSPPFSVAARYWPARTGPFWWEHYQRSEVTRDLNDAAVRAVSTLALSLTWSDFQPDPTTVSVPAMRRLESVLDAGAERGVGFVVTLFPASLSSFTWLPGWTLSLEGQSSRSVLAGNTISRRRPYNLFENEQMVQAEIRQVREVLSAFRDHPAINAWVLGDGLTHVAAPSSARAFGEWLGRLAEAAAQSGSRHELRHTLSAQALICLGTVSPKAATDSSVRLQVRDDWHPAWMTVSAPRRAAFLAGYAARLAGAPIYLADLGRCTGPNGQGCLDPPAAAAESEETLTLSHSYGAEGCEAASLYDYDEQLERAVPFRQHPDQLTRGLLFADGKEKPAAEVWRSWQDRVEPVLPVPGHVPCPDEERRSRDPEGTARATLEEYFA